MEKTWIFRAQPDFETRESLAHNLKITPALAHLLWQRGLHSFEEASQFFNPDLGQTHDPFLMLNMAEAVRRLTQAIKAQHRIMLLGDYDVDGTTAVALSKLFLQHHTQNLEYYIPDRYTEGYGVSEQSIDYAIQSGVQLIITLDCGIKSVQWLGKAANHGIDVIVCDHHEPGDELPNALILDPKQPNCPYPFKELSGCGVAFKLYQALCIANEWNLEPLYEQLDLLALSIGADIVQVTDENRIFAYHGLKLFNQNPRYAFDKLLKLAGKSSRVTLSDLVFIIAPRINAAGRMSSGSLAVELMTNDQVEVIDKLASEIHAFNAERRNVDAAITASALQQIASFGENSKTTVVFDKSWHKGVVGIVASRLIETHFKPTIVLTEANGKLTGSARTVNDFNIYDALCACEKHLEQFGGHTHAAGLTLLPEKLVDFRIAFENIVKKTLQPTDLHPSELVDLEIFLGDLYQPEENRMKLPKFFRQIERFEPFGPGNMKPVFMARNVFSSGLTVLQEKHIKMSVFQPESDVLVPAIGFNLAHKADLAASGIPFDLLFTLEKNTWRDKTTLQLSIKDLREAQ